MPRLLRGRGAPSAETSARNDVALRPRLKAGARQRMDRARHRSMPGAGLPAMGRGKEVRPVAGPWLIGGGSMGVKTRLKGGLSAR